MKIQIELLTDTAIVPTRATKQSAGYDLYSDLLTPIEISSGETKLIPTGICVALPENTFGGIFARSGLATRQGLRPSNCVGVIDSDYRGEIKVALRNDSKNIQIIEPKQRIAQLVIMPFISGEFEIVDELNKTERNNGGFGSTGK